MRNKDELAARPDAPALALEAAKQIWAIGDHCSYDTWLEESASIIVAAFSKSTAPVPAAGAAKVEKEFLK